MWFERQLDSLQRLFQGDFKDQDQPNMILIVAPT